ncbi:4965_t:CDS:1, partial [Racocetra persica]
MIYEFTTSETPKFYYLCLFKEEHRGEIAAILKESLFVYQVVSLALRNSKDILTIYRIKPTRFDKIQAIDLEANEEN